VTRVLRATAAQMRDLEIVQQDDPVLHRATRRLDLPIEAGMVSRIAGRLWETAERFASVHTVSKGLGLAAPQIGVDRSVAVVRSTSGEQIVLLNPRVVRTADELDDRQEGCLSFFDVRGLVPRSIEIDVESAQPDGGRRVATYRAGLARLVAHEIDHLDGLLYTARMRPGETLIPAGEYRGTGLALDYGAH
jgi:peptide deformylase